EGGIRLRAGRSSQRKRDDRERRSTRGECHDPIRVGIEASNVLTPRVVASHDIETGELNSLVSAANSLESDMRAFSLGISAIVVFSMTHVLSAQVPPASGRGNAQTTLPRWIPDPESQ